MNILFVCTARIGSQMASPGIRSYYMAQAMQKILPHDNVTLGYAGETDFDPRQQNFRMERIDNGRLRSVASRHDVIVANQLPLSLFPLAIEKRLVLDLYTPFLTEWREFSKPTRSPILHQAYMDAQKRVLFSQLAVADFILCANERQRDLYIGMLNSMGTITTRAYDADSTLRSYIAIVPYGVRPKPPVLAQHRLRGVIDGIGHDDRLIIWNGSMVEWYDIESLIRAVYNLSLVRNDVKLMFMGAEHPDFKEETPLTGMGSGVVRRAIALARDLGIMDRHVFFNLGWATNEEAEDYLLESDLGVCTYFDSMETRFSFRVRYLDLFWARLPIICTEGDIVADMVRERGLGLTVPEGDVAALTNAIARLLDDEAYRASCRAELDRVADEFRWERVLQPLVDFCHRDRPLAVRKRERLMPLAAQLLDRAGSAVSFNILERMEPLLRRMARDS